MSENKFFIFPVDKVVRREGQADVYVFRSGIERSKASDVAFRQPIPSPPPAPPQHTASKKK
jgi:hypothetical protein